MQTGGTSIWDQILSLLFLVIFTIYFFTDIPQRLQFYRYSRAAATRLAMLESLVNESVAKVQNYLSRLGVENAYAIVKRFLENYFVIEPVDKEPIDIIRRLDHVIRTSEEKAKKDLENILPGLGRDARNNVAVALAISSALYSVYKTLRHYYIVGRKYENWILLMQLAVILPQIVKELSAYVKAIDDIVRGVPIGDSVGPLVAYKLARLAQRVEVVEDTVVSIVEFEGRKIYVIKARGPGATVGKPGKALAKIAEELGCNIARIITVDAALKLEGESSGEVFEGSGAAIGDIGPEKIEIERIAVKCRAPLDAVIIKMSSQEAIRGITKELAEAVEKAYQRVVEIIRSRTRVGDTVVVIGVGNTVGVY